VAETLALPPIVCVICEICGLSLIPVFGLKPWQAGADEIGEIRGITRADGSLVN
jgi:hypothetical protein